MLEYVCVFVCICVLVCCAVYDGHGCLCGLSMLRAVYVCIGLIYDVRIVICVMPYIVVIIDDVV